MRYKRASLFKFTKPARGRLKIPAWTASFKRLYLPATPTPYQRRKVPTVPVSITHSMQGCFQFLLSVKDEFHTYYVQALNII